jgi:hypothetical protein
MSTPQLFVAALGACLLEFVLNSCRLRSVPVERLSVEMAYQEAPRPRRIGAVEAAIHLAPDPPDEVKRRLLRVARQATLANTMVRPPEVGITFTGEGGRANANLRVSLSRV